MPFSGPLEIPNPDEESTKSLLFHIFRKESFWEGQWDAIQRTLQGLDSLVLLPTGGGKTLAFQLASLLLPGVCLAVDPLIALIDDQLDNLRSHGIDRAVGITSQLTRVERKAHLDAFARGHYLFCYVTPERLLMQGFREVLRALTAVSPVCVVAIDEVHCVSEWGHDFRPSYLNIARNTRNYCQKEGVVPPLLGLTGTASRSVLRDVQRELEIADFDAIITPETFDRPELRFEVLSCRSSEKEGRLLGLLSSMPQRFRLSQNVLFQPRGEDSATGLIFYPHVNGRFGITEGYQMLREKLGAVVGLYSGGAPRNVPADKWREAKAAYADRFKNNEITILACTKAFGMGIDKPNIRYTVHTNLPASIEGFYQEAGRAGRDRELAVCCVLVSCDHPQRAKQLLAPDTPLQEIAAVVNDVSWSEQDDITRMMYFHVSSFRGAEEELREVRRLVNELGELGKERTVAIGYSDDHERGRREKAVHRLVVVGAIEDYLMNYAQRQINIRLSGNDKEANLRAFRDYIANYDPNIKIADTVEQDMQQHLKEPLESFILRLVDRLISGFVYNTIEKSRRRSLNEMLAACSGNPTNQSVRERILAMLNWGVYSDLLEEARHQPHALSSTINDLAEQVVSPNNAAELRGQAASLLRAYPENPALLLIRSLAEALCRDRDEQVVLENLRAFVSYALSPTVWDLPLEEVIGVASTFVNQIGAKYPDLASKSVRAVLGALDFDRTAARGIVMGVQPEHSLPAVNQLLSELRVSLGKILI